MAEELSYEDVVGNRTSAPQGPAPPPSGNGEITWEQLKGGSSPGVSLPQQAPSSTPATDQAIGGWGKYVADTNARMKALYKPVDWSGYPAPIRQTAESVTKYIQGMIPQTGEQWARTAGIPTQMPTSPEGIKQWMGVWFPPLRPGMDFPQQVYNRAKEIHEADQTPAGSQQRYDAGIGTVLDLIQLASLKGVGELGSAGKLGGARAGIRPGEVPPTPGAFKPGDFQGSVGDVIFQGDTAKPPIQDPALSPEGQRLTEQYGAPYSAVESKEIPGVQPYAKQPGDAQVQGGPATLGQQARPDGSVPVPGDSDYVVGTPQGEAAGGQLPRTEPIPGTEAVVSEAPKATPGQIGGWRRRVSAAQEEIHLLEKIGGIDPAKIQARVDEIDHLNKQIAGEIPPDALPPVPESSKGGVEKRIGEMYAAKTPEEQAKILEQNMGGPKHEPKPIGEGFIDEGINQEHPIIAAAIDRYTHGQETQGLIDALRHEDYPHYYDDLQRVLKLHYGDELIPVTRVEGYAGGSGEGAGDHISVSTLPDFGVNAAKQGAKVTKGFVRREDVVAAGNEAEGELIIKKGGFKEMVQEAVKGAPQQPKEADADAADLKALQQEISDTYKRGERPSILKTQERDALLRKIEEKKKAAAQGEPLTPEEQRTQQLDDELHNLRVENTQRIARGEEPLPIPVEKTHELGQLLAGERRNPGRGPDGKIIQTTEPTKLLPQEQTRLHQLEDDSSGLQNAVLRYEKLSKSKKLTRQEREDWFDKQQALWDNFRQQHKLWEKSGQNYDVVIVGLGAAGLKMAGHLPYEGLRVLGIEKGPRAGGAAKESLELFNVGRGSAGSTGRDYFNAKVGTAKNGGAEIRTNTEVVNIIEQPDGSVHVVTGQRVGNGLKNIKVIPASNVALFPGTKPTIRPYPGSQYTGWGSTERLKNLTNGKEGMVYGGSNAVTQAVLGSLDLGTKKMTVVTRHNFGPEASINQDRRILDHVKNGNVELVTGTIDHVTANPDGSRTVHVGPSEDNPRADYSFKVAHVENFLGGDNNTAWLPKGIDLVKVGRKEGFVKTLGDGSRRTTMPRVFVGGDVRAPTPGETKGYRIDLAEGDATAIGLTIQDEIGHFRKTGKLPEWKVSDAEIHQIDEELKLMKGMKPFTDETGPMIPESGEKAGTPGSHQTSREPTSPESSESTTLDWTKKSGEPSRPVNEVPVPPGGLAFPEAKKAAEPPVPAAKTLAKHLVSSTPQQQPSGDVPFAPRFPGASRLAELQQRQMRFERGSGPALSAREWEELVNLKAKEPGRISEIMGIPSVTDMLDEARYGKLTKAQKSSLAEVRSNLKAGKITRNQYDSEINKIVSDRPLPPGDIEGEFTKVEEPRLALPAPPKPQGVKAKPLDFESSPNGDFRAVVESPDKKNKLYFKFEPVPNEQGAYRIDFSNIGPTRDPGTAFPIFRKMLPDAIDQFRKKYHPDTLYTLAANDTRFNIYKNLLEKAGVDFEPIEVLNQKGFKISFGKPATDSRVTGHPITEVPLKDIVNSKDVPQFKHGANEQGIVEPLAGKYERVGTPPVQLWERLDFPKTKKYELISGRHRRELANRTGEKTIPAQIHREADGFDARQAARLDAELNIRDNQGSIADYANYFKNSGITQQAAEARGLLARGAGKTGFGIARGSGESLFALHQSGRISDAQAHAIAEAAPGDEGLQRVGIKAALDGESGSSVGNLMRGVRARLGSHPEGKQLDLLSSDDTAMQTMVSAGKRASALQRELNQHIASVAGAAKHPGKARALGVNVEDPASVTAKLAELRRLSERAKHWDMDPEMRDMILKGDKTPGQMIEALSPGTKTVGVEPITTKETEPARPPISWDEAISQGKTWLAAGGDIRNVVRDFHRSGKVTTTDMGKARAHLNDLRAVTNSLGDELLKRPNDSKLHARLNDALDAEEKFNASYRPMAAVAKDTLPVLDGYAPLDEASATSYTGLIRRFKEIRDRGPMVTEEGAAKRIAKNAKESDVEYKKATADAYNAMDNEFNRIKTDRTGPATIETATKAISKLKEVCG